MQKIISLEGDFYVIDDEEIKESDYFLYKDEKIAFKTSAKLEEHGGELCHRSGIRLYEAKYCNRITHSSKVLPGKNLPKPLYRGSTV